MAEKEEKTRAIDDRELGEVTGGKYLGPTFVYIFQDGDSLSVLAQRFGTTVRVLLDLNNIRDHRLVRPGTRLLIPQR